MNPKDIQKEKETNKRCSLCGKDKEMRYWLCSDNCLKRQWNKNDFFRKYEELKKKKGKLPQIDPNH